LPFQYPGALWLNLDAMTSKNPAHDRRGQDAERDPKFDSKELRLARKKLAKQLDPYDPAKRAEMDGDVLDFLESVGALFNRNLLNKELAASSFSYRATRWWEVAKNYIADQRRDAHDESLYTTLKRLRKRRAKTNPISVKPP
jgi:hypothetical protein